MECLSRRMIISLKVFRFQIANGKIPVLICSDVDYVDTWKAMERLVDKGLVKSIGVSNFNSKQIERLLANCRIKPVTNQVITVILL